MPAITVIKIRQGTAAAWSSANPILESGEPGFETDTYRLRVGDGVTNWNSLGFNAITVPKAIVETAINHTLNAATDVGATVDASGGSRKITLPPIAANKDVEFFIKKIDSSGNTVIIEGNAAETIDGELNQVISEQYAAITVYGGSTEWHIL